LLRTKLAELFRAIISELIGEGRLPSEVLTIPIEISDPKNPEHGDFACNFALVASKAAGMNPRALGEALAEKLGSTYGTIISNVEVAGPGFINLRLFPGFVAGYVETVLTPDFKLEAASKAVSPLKINVEFVSVNPNGPITIGSGRGAAYGSTLCKILEAVGHTIHREYYINDGVSSTQMALFAESVKAIVEGRPVPDNGYKGDYVHEVAAKISNNGESIEWYQQNTQDKMLEAQNDVLSKFGVEYDTWFSEQSLHDSGMVEIEIEAMIAKGIADYSLTRTKLKMAKGGKIEDVLFETQKGDTKEDEGEPGQDDGTGNQPPPTHDKVTASHLPRLGEGLGADEPNLNNLVPTLMPMAEPSMMGSIADPDPLEDDPAETSFTEDPATLKLDAEEINREISEGSPVETDGITLWLRSAKLGDDMDRVLRRRDGRLTYIASDVAYHKDKFNRPAGANKLITVLGPDHHGYIGRLTAVVAAMMMETPKPGHSLEDEIDAKLYKDSGEKEACEVALAKARKQLEVQIFQLVRFVKDGEPAPMRKRDGNIYALIDHMREIGTKLKPLGTEIEQLEAGKDVARFFYLMRSHDTTFDFDLDLAEKQSDENPVFYVQYAHARICSVLAKAQEALGTAAKPDLAKLLIHDREKAMIKKIVDLPDEVRRASEDYGVHRIAIYAIELARTFHGFYDGCRVIQVDQPELSAARVRLCEATKRTLKITLDLLGVSAPEKM
jgi:arginyl-tRNA synthetase